MELSVANLQIIWSTFIFNLIIQHNVEDRKNCKIANIYSILNRKYHPHVSIPFCRKYNLIIRRTFTLYLLILAV